jgi:transcriptional regulator with XRE-family HTH domain
MPDTKANGAMADPPEKQKKAVVVITEADREFARRIREAMAEAGYRTQRDIARALKVGQSTVNRYLSGERRPKPHLMERISGLTGKEVIWFHAGVAGTSPAELAADALEETIWRLVEGNEGIGEAWDRGTLEPGWLSLRERRLYEKMEPQIREAIRKKAPTAWGDLTAVGRRQLIRAIAREMVGVILARRSGSDLEYDLDEPVEEEA